MGPRRLKCVPVYRFCSILPDFNALDKRTAVVKRGRSISSVGATGTFPDAGVPSPTVATAIYGIVHPSRCGAAGHFPGIVGSRILRGFWEDVNYAECAASITPYRPEFWSRASFGFRFHARVV